MQKTNKSTNRDKKIEQLATNYVTDFYFEISKYITKDNSGFNLQNCHDILTQLQNLSIKLNADLQKLDK